MINEDKVVKFQLVQKIYFLVTLITLGVVVAFLLLLNATGAEWLVDLPFDITYVVIFLMWANLAHFLFGIYQLIRYYSVIKKIEDVRLWKTVLSLVLSPVIFVFVYILLILSVFVSCARNN
jgi:succinate dehydrogenase/fumarate reductase cytochrome b subunit